MIYHYMTSYDYIIKVIVDSCMIWFHFDCIMQLKKSYHIATNVCSKKSATTFGDLPECLGTDSQSKLLSWSSIARFVSEYWLSRRLDSWDA